MRAIADQFESLVEHATGREVRLFMSEMDLVKDIAVEIFLPGPARTDMSGFEEAGEAADAQD